MAGILLDTNIVSALMRPCPEQVLMDWFAHRTHELFYISAVTQAEIQLGIALLPAGKRRQLLADAAAKMFARDFAGRCLPFDTSCTPHYAAIVSARRRSGHGTSTEDALIAAIAVAHGYPLATRNTKDFLHIDGLTLYNPWHS